MRTAEEPDMKALLEAAFTGVACTPLGTDSTLVVREAIVHDLCELELGMLSTAETVYNSGVVDKREYQ